MDLRYSLDTHTESITQWTRGIRGKAIAIHHTYTNDPNPQSLLQRLRPMSYSKSHVILIAFAIDTPDSLENVTTKVRTL
jgi:hypothetical protein